MLHADVAHLRYHGLMMLFIMPFILFEALNFIVLTIGVVFVFFSALVIIAVVASSLMFLAVAYGTIRNWLKRRKSW
jgi:hypothetical protein